MKKILFNQKLPPKIKYYYNHPNLEQILGEYLIKYFKILNTSMNRPLVIVCIGTDRSTGDSLGPLVGTKLTELDLEGLVVYGTLNDPVHAANIEEKIKLIEKHENPIIVAVDASLGKSESVGCITLGPGAVKPGAGVNKKLPEIGDIHFTGIVNVGGYMEYFVLQNTRLNVVMEIATAITNSIALACKAGQRDRIYKYAIARDIYLQQVPEKPRP